MAIKFELRLKQSEIPALVEQHKKTEEFRSLELPALAAGERIGAGHYTRKNLMDIVYWKSSRSTGLVRKNHERDVHDALRLAAGAQTDRAAVAVLLGLHGVQIPVASSILTAFDQGRFTVIDYRALEALSVKQSVLTVDFYLEYLATCKCLAREFEVSLRDFDRALWRWSKNRDRENTWRSRAADLRSQRR